MKWRSLIRDMGQRAIIVQGDLSLAERRSG